MRIPKHRRRVGRACAATTMLAALAVVPCATTCAPGLLVWTLRTGELVAPRALPLIAIHVGSLQKPFVARAWATSHPNETPPLVTCDGSSGCWLREGHGTLGLARAVSVSCNTYFRALARATPERALSRALEEAGFSIVGPVTVEEAIGLQPDAGRANVTIAPGDLLRAYVTLVREPWPEGESVRREVVRGLRAAARDGTARGLHRPGWAKTGTTSALDGRPLATSGLVVFVDEDGTGTLAVLPRGTGRDAARELGRQSATVGAARLRSSPTTPGRRQRSNVRIRLFSTLKIREAGARNLGSAPVAWSGGWVGPGAYVRLDAGGRLGRGQWEIAIPALRLVRRVEGSLACARDENNDLRIVAEMPTRAYVAGVLTAEIRNGEPRLCDALAAAVLRFLGDGPRHREADVCDSTHCAWFVGDGPIAEWPAPDRPRLLGRPVADGCGEIDATRWAAIVESAATAGPHHWTSHCGGQPLTPHRVWGNGIYQVTPCPRHHSGPERPWSRHWDARSLERAFGRQVTGLQVASDDGVWMLHVWLVGQSQPERLRYDDAHRLLARAFGWAGLPSPADGVRPAPDGFVAHGVGLGHRVGLCLGEGAR